MKLKKHYVEHYVAFYINASLGALKRYLVEDNNNRALIQMQINVQI